MLYIQDSFFSIIKSCYGLRSAILIEELDDILLNHPNDILQ